MINQSVSGTKGCRHWGGVHARGGANIEIGGQGEGILVGMAPICTKSVTDVVTSKKRGVKAPGNMQKRQGYSNGKIAWTKGNQRLK